MKLALEVIAGIILLIGGIAGFFTWAGTPPYVEHDNHKREYRTLEIEVVGGALQFYEYRQFLQRQEIEKKEQQKREMLKNVSERAEWFKYYEQSLRDLRADKAKTDKTVNKYEKRLEMK